MSPSTRGCALPDPGPAGAGEAQAQHRLQGLARYILDERERRRWHFPRAVFDEIPWEILLLLYASESRSLSKTALVNGLLVSPDLVGRWIDYLEREVLLKRSQDHDGSPALELTPGGLASLELYLLDRLQRSGAGVMVGPHKPASLPAWGIALLVLVTAILSVAATWFLVAD